MSDQILFITRERGRGEGKTEHSEQIERTIKEERGRLFSFIRKNVKVREDAEDILQDVFYQLVSGFEEIAFVERISAWLFRVARNKIIDWQRRKSKRPLHTEEIIIAASDSGDPVTLADIVPDLSLLPDEAYWQNLIWEEIEEALDKMPPEQSEIFVMNELEGLSFREISEIKNVSVNTLLSRKRYAVLFLRKYLKELFEEIKNNV